MARTTTDTECPVFHDWGDSPEELVLIAAWRKVESALRRIGKAAERYGPESAAVLRAGERADLQKDRWLELLVALENVGLIQLGD